MANYRITNMNYFHETFNELLLESPYLVDLTDKGVPNDTDMFDLQLEDITDKKSLVKYLYILFFHGKKTDKYGSSVSIKTPEHRSAMFNCLIDDDTVLLVISKIANLGGRDQAKKWLITLKNKFDEFELLRENKKTRSGFNVSIHRTQDDSLVKTFKPTAYTPKQAKGYIIQKLKETYPEYLNDYYYIKVSEITVTTTTYNPKDYWWNRD